MTVRIKGAFSSSAGAESGLQVVRSWDITSAELDRLGTPMTAGTDPLRRYDLRSHRGFAASLIALVTGSVSVLLVSGREGTRPQPAGEP